MTIKNALKNASEYLNERNVEDPSKEAGLLLSWVLKMNLASIYAYPDRELNEYQKEEFLSVVERRGRHEPFAYITGECEFLSLSFEVNSHVLIPRPDTEILAETVLAALGKPPILLSGQEMFRLPKKEGYHMLDIGTGSGCLAVSIAKNASNLCFDALDISEQALNIAQRNAMRHGVIDRINFIHGDFLKNTTLHEKLYDLIISNPPYIPQKDISSLMPSVRDYEPHTALVGGDADGLLFYRTMALRTQELLKDQGIIAVECGFDQGRQVKAIFESAGLSVILLKDLAGIDRVVAAKKGAKV